MKEKCFECGKSLRKKTSNYYYKESGLDNVYLQNITVRECSCGISYPSIFRLPRLNELIAISLLEKPFLLTGREVRFLRKNIYFSSKEFAKVLGVEKTTLSKWENGTQRHREAYDRSIRLTYMTFKGIKGERARMVRELLRNIHFREADLGYVITAEKVGDDYDVVRKIVSGGKAQKLTELWAFSRKMFRAVTVRHGFLWNQFQTESNLTFASPDVLSTKTTSRTVMPGGGQ